MAHGDRSTDFLQTKNNTMKKYAIIKNWDDFREVEMFLIKNGVAFNTSNFNEGYAFVFHC